ncbi:hypothetical protein FRB98_002609, partial [Tulasnella sp. 332]
MFSCWWLALVTPGFIKAFTWYDVNHHHIANSPLTTSPPEMPSIRRYRSRSKPKEPSSFGSVDDFWTKYDTVAEKFDKEMLDRINNDLDVLLVFAALFSAVITAFIVPAMSALSPNPANQTNYLLQYLIINGTNPSITTGDLAMPFPVDKSAVRQNCLFFASLCCSVLAAGGAVLAKQWLQEYARMQQTGSVDQQVKKRAERFAGAEKWGLHVVVKILPLLLLGSVALFFYALADSLLSVNHTVAYVIWGFGIAGMAVYMLTVVVAVVYAACPYRTAVSGTIISIRAAAQSLVYSKEFLGKWPTAYSVVWNLPSTLTIWLGERIFTMFPLSREMKSHMDRKIRKMGSKRLRRAYNGVVLLSICGALLFVWTAVDASLVSLLLIFLLLWPGRTFDDPALLIRSAMWMVETAPISDHILTVAHNIPLITNFYDIQLVATSSAFVSLLSKFTDTLLRAQKDCTDVVLAEAVTLGRAIAYVLLANPEESSVAVGDACLAGLGDWEPNKKLGGVWDSDFKHLFEAVVITCCPRKSEDDISPLLDPIKYRRSARLRLLVQALGKSPNPGFKSFFDATIYLRQGIIMGFCRFHEHHKKSYRLRPPLDIPLFSALHLEGTVVDESYLSCVSRTLSEIIRLQSAKHKKLSAHAKAQLAWASPSGLPQDILDAFNAFLGYYTELQQPVSQEDGETLTTMLRHHSRLLVHLQALPLPFGLLLKKSGKRSLQIYRGMHVTLNSTIEQLNSLDIANTPPGAGTLLLSCQNELIRVLESLLLSESLQLASADGDLASTSRHAETVCPTNETLLRGILYRYFLLIAYPPTPLHVLRGAARPYDAPAQLQNLPISPVLTSALKLSAWLYQDVDIGIQWRFYEDFVQQVIAGNADMNPMTRTPAAHRSPQPIARALVSIAGKQGIERYEAMGPSLLWLAERIRRKDWEEVPDWGRVIGLFVRAIEWQGGEPVDSDVSAGERSCTHKEAAGVLFLRAWERSIIVPPIPLGESDASTSWTSATAIEAFK